MMDLLKGHILGGARVGTPRGDMALERAQLPRLVARGGALHQFGKQGLGLNGRVAFKLGTHPGPVVGKRIGAGTMGAWLLELAGQSAGTFILAGGADTHAGAGGRLFLGFAFQAFAFHQQYLAVGLHGPLLRGAMVGQPARDANRHVGRSAPADLIVAQQPLSYAGRWYRDKDLNLASLLQRQLSYR